MPDRTLYLVRHGQSTWNAAGRWQGQADPPLSPEGVAQASRTADALTAIGVAAVLASDLVRARETGRVVAERCGLDLEIDPDLREIDVGSWSGSTRAEIGAADPAGLEKYFEGLEGWSGGETYADLDVRTARVAERLDARAANPTDTGTLVVVTHGGTIRSLVLTLLDIDRSHRWRLGSVGHASACTLVRSPHGWRLTGYGIAMNE